MVQIILDEDRVAYEAFIAKLTDALAPKLVAMMKKTPQTVCSQREAPAHHHLSHQEHLHPGLCGQRCCRGPAGPAACTPVDIPTGWDPRTNQKPTGLLIAPPAAGPPCTGLRLPSIRFMP